jgi:hydroxymethylpyrimidine pyrophosphatase-like HAD family hydrolase
LPLGQIILVTGGFDNRKASVNHRAVDMNQARGFRAVGVLTVEQLLSRDGRVHATANLRSGEHAVESPELLVIDAAGPPELLSGPEWTRVVEILRENAFRLVLVVASPLKAIKLRELLATASVTELQLTSPLAGLLPAVLDELATPTRAGDTVAQLADVDLIAADLDGTLLAAGFPLPEPGTIASLRLAEESGAVVVICTGRPAQRAGTVIGALGLRRGYSITFGGAETRDLASDQVMFRTTLEGTTSRTILAIAAAGGLTAETHGSPAGVLRIVLGGDSDRVEAAAKAIDASVGGSVCMLRPVPNALAVQASAATKIRALQDLAARLDLDRRSIVFLGDAADDVPALLWAGLGVAVADESSPTEAAVAADLTIGLEGIPVLLLRVVLERALRSTW